MPMKKKRLIKYIVLIICLLILVGIWAKHHNFSIELMLEYTPENPLKAAVILLCLYALKSATVFFPIIVLEIAAGHLFSPLTALGINFAGILITLTIPYLIGKTIGLEMLQKAVRAYPRFGEIMEKQQKHSFFLCFFLRVISCLPGDIVTMYFGATKTPFWQNAVAGTLGIFPGMVLATLMGSSIQDPHSPMFWISALLTVALSVLSGVMYYLYKKSNRNPQQLLKSFYRCLHRLFGR